jgi:hypothetical protein
MDAVPSTSGRWPLQAVRQSAILMMRCARHVPATAPQYDSRLAQDEGVGYGAGSAPGLAYAADSLAYGSHSSSHTGRLATHSNLHSQQSGYVASGAALAAELSQLLGGGQVGDPVGGGGGLPGIGSGLGVV